MSPSCQARDTEPENNVMWLLSQGSLKLKQIGSVVTILPPHLSELKTLGITELWKCVSFHP